MGHVAVPGMIAYSGPTHENTADERSQCSMRPRTVSEVKEWVETVGSQGRSRDKSGTWERRSSTKVNVNDWYMP